MITVKNAINIQLQCQLAINNAAGTTDEDKKYEYIREGYETVRTLQGETQATDHAESPRAALEEYLTESLSSIEKVINTMETAAAGDVYVPGAIDGLVFIPEGGSGSGSASA